jgi:hypothetical protein
LNLAPSMGSLWRCLSPSSSPLRGDTRRRGLPLNPHVATHI